MFRFKLSSLLTFMTLSSVYVAFLHNQPFDIIGVVLFLSVSAVIVPALILHFVILGIVHLSRALKQRSIIPLIRRSQMAMGDAVWAIWLIVAVSAIHHVFEFAEPSIRVGLILILSIGSVASLLVYSRIRQFDLTAR